MLLPPGVQGRLSGRRPAGVVRPAAAGSGPIVCGPRHRGQPGHGGSGRPAGPRLQCTGVLGVRWLAEFVVQTVPCLQPCLRVEAQLLHPAADAERQQMQRQRHLHPTSRIHQHFQHACLHASPSSPHLPPPAVPQGALGVSGYNPYAARQGGQRISGTGMPQRPTHSTHATLDSLDSDALEAVSPMAAASAAAAAAAAAAVSEAGGPPGEAAGNGNLPEFLRVRGTLRWHQRPLTSWPYLRWCRRCQQLLC